MKDRFQAQIKIILFQNKLKGIEKLIQDMKGKINHNYKTLEKVKELKNKQK